MSDSWRRSPLRRVLHGPVPALPAWLDRAAARWAALDGRARLWLGGAALAGVLLAGQAWAAQVINRWGGAPVSVWVATQAMAPGQVPAHLERRLLPPAVIPPDALAAVDRAQPLAFGLPPGAILTRWHVDPRGSAAALPAGVRAVPVPVQPGWGVQAGGWVDVWVVAADQSARLVARACPVLSLQREEHGPATALVALPEQAVGDAARGIAAGRVLLTHTPARH